MEACGICHTDSHTVDANLPGVTLPRVPGHEVVGRIDAIGPGVSGWEIDERVGVGLVASADGVCEPCRRGDSVNCQNPVLLGATADGGYAEVMVVEARGLVSIPDDLSSADAAPLLCAGVTTYNALRNSGLRSGDLVAVQGIGGLGQYGHNWFELRKPSSALSRRFPSYGRRGPGARNAVTLVQATLRVSSCPWSSSAGTLAWRMAGHGRTSVSGNRPPGR